ncbi:MAG: DUF2357 domain-containing protein [Firmicutes bacterium]|nr:DUF2357 domain-containing protein [Bacillota bacterium]
MVLNDDSFSDLLNVIKSAPKKEIGGASRRENKKCDSVFIVEIERCLQSIEKIVHNPRQFIKEEYEVVPVEIAKKIGSQSIRHLAMHSEFVKEIKPNGDVVPDKILATLIDEEIAIYENRFVMTLIRKLVLFIELRFRYIEKHWDSNNSDVVTMKSTVVIEGIKYEYESSLKLLVPSEDEGEKAKNDNLLKRLAILRQRVNYLLSTPFMRAMKKANVVTGKIQMTNLLRTNSDYRKAYELWNFISRYDDTGVTYSVKEDKIAFDNDYLNQLYALMLGSFLSLRSDKSLPAPKATKKYTVTPQFVQPIFDKELADDRFLEKMNGKNVALRIKTAAQIEKQEKRLAEKEKERLKKIKEAEMKKAAEEARKLKELEKAKAKKEREKTLAAERKIAAQFKLKAIAEEKKLRRREEAIRRAEIRAEERKILEEQERLKSTRERIKKLAIETKSPVKKPSNI